MYIYESNYKILYFIFYKNYLCVVYCEFGVKYILYRERNNIIF